MTVIKKSYDKPRGGERNECSRKDSQMYCDGEKTDAIAE
jgi:hypothetical protein